MPELVQQIHKGLNTIDAESRLSEGFVRDLANWIYNLDDKISIHKIPGRTQAGSLPTGGTTANTKGLRHAQFDPTANQLVIHSNSKLWRTPAAASLAAWNEIQDQAGTAFPRSGSYLKSIPDGRGGVLLFGGGANERTLVLDEDLNARFLGMNKPGKPAAKAITAAATFIRPNADTGTGFANPINAYDVAGQDFDTAATATSRTLGTKTTTWSFAAGAVPTVANLYLQISSSSLSPEDTSWDPTGPGQEATRANVTIEISVTGSGGTYVTVFDRPIPLGVPLIVQHNVNVATNLSQIHVRANLVYTAGVQTVRASVHEIWISSNGGSTGLINTGVAAIFYYATTEVYSITLASGKSIVVESAPSDTVKFEINKPANTTYGVTITPEPTVNLETDGYPATLLYRNIYRTLNGGVWPNLGFVGTAPIGKAEFHDAFNIAIGTLGSPGIYTASVGDATIHAAGMPPAMRDACLFKGAVVCIPEDDPGTIAWGLPAQPDYFPLPAHSTSPIQGDRNEEFKGIFNLADSLIILWTRTQTLRLRDLAFANQATFDVRLLKIDTLSSNQGLAGSPLSFTSFESQRGHAMVAWVSDNGIWMTDGSLPVERGMGVHKMTVHLNWEKDVDNARLDETRLTFDTRTQTLWFDYYDPAGNLRSITLHTSGAQWVQSGEDQLVPKLAGPHTKPLAHRAVGELAGQIQHWSVSTESTPKVYQERLGTDDAGDDIISVVEGGWLNAGSPLVELHIYEGAVYHSDWGASESLSVDVLARFDELGTVRPVAKRGISLRGERASQLGWINSAGQSFKVRAVHTGKTISDGSRVKSLGPIGLIAESEGDIES